MSTKNRFVISAYSALSAYSAIAVFATTAPAQQADTARKPTPLAAVTVTATRKARSTFDTPQPVTVLDSVALREKMPNGIADAFRDVAGLDATGVGPNQRRPEIRLQRGQRILLLEDGLRLNNARRQQDFGELPALAGSDVQQVEVVRGPSSVLYGTDAIGGVVNVITKGVPRGATPAGDVHGFLNFRYGSAGTLTSPDGAVTGRWGNFSLRANGSYRDADSYSAPKGSFGNITLANDVEVFDTGVRDRSYRAQLGYDLSPTSEVYARGEQYVANNAGFGWIDPNSYDPGSAKVQIVYPDQQYTRFAAGYRANREQGLGNTKYLITLFAEAGVLKPVESEQALDDLAQLLWMVGDFWLVFKDTGGSPFSAADSDQGVRLFRRILTPYLKGKSK